MSPRHNESLDKAIIIPFKNSGGAKYIGVRRDFLVIDWNERLFILPCVTFVLVSKAFSIAGYFGLDG